MVAMSRRKRMVAHDITDAFFSAGRNGTAQDVLLRGSFGCTFHAVTV